MQYTIENKQLSVVETPRIPGVITAEGKVFSNADGSRTIKAESGRIRIELSQQGAEQVQGIPDDVDQAKLERCMDDLLVFTGDMTEDERDQKWQLGDYATEAS